MSLNWFLGLALAFCDDTVHSFRWINTFFFVLRDTEYYDYGHGEAQEPSYEPYGKDIQFDI